MVHLLSFGFFFQFSSFAIACFVDYYFEVNLAVTQTVDQGVDHVNFTLGYITCRTFPDQGDISGSNVN